MTTDESGIPDRTATVQTPARGGPTAVLVVASGVLVGVGALALVRGLHVYLHFHSYASGIATERAVQSVFWAVAGGTALAIGASLLATALLRTR